MNRFVVFGVAMFFAIVGIALLGADNKADAGQRCCGCSGASCDGCSGCHNDCGGCRGCGGLFAKDRCCGCGGGLFSRKNRCCGAPCCGVPQPTCCGCGGSAPVMNGGDTTGGDDVPPAPEAASTIERSPIVYRSVSFRR